MSKAPDITFKLQLNTFELQTALIYHYFIALEKNDDYYPSWEIWSLQNAIEVYWYLYLKCDVLSRKSCIRWFLQFFLKYGYFQLDCIFLMRWLRANMSTLSWILACLRLIQAMKQYFLFVELDKYLHVCDFSVQKVNELLWMWKNFHKELIKTPLNLVFPLSSAFLTEWHVTENPGIVNIILYTYMMWPKYFLLLILSYLLGRKSWLWLFYWFQLLWFQIQHE